MKAYLFSSCFGHHASDIYYLVSNSYIGNAIIGIIMWSCQREACQTQTIKSYRTTAFG